MMTVQTKYLGKVKVEEKNTVQFANGLPGFIDESQFILLNLPGNPVFQTLQSMKTPELAFIVTNPYDFYQDYTFELDNSILESLRIKNQEDVLVLTIVTLTSPFECSTINLKAPLIINAKQNVGKQYILNNDDYKTKTPIVLPKVTQAGGE